MSNEDKGTNPTTPKSKDKGDSRLKGDSVKQSKANTSKAKSKGITGTEGKTKTTTSKSREIAQGKEQQAGSKPKRNRAKSTELVERVSKAQTKYTLEQKTKLIHAILSVYATGKYTLESCCEAQGIAARTFKYWVDDNAELATLYEEYKITMREVSKDELRKLAEKSLEKLVKGGEYEESTTILHMVKGKEGVMKAEVKEVRKVKKVVQPNTAAVLFTLTNLDPKQWRNTQLIEGKLNISAQVKQVEKLSDDELQAEIDRLSKQPIVIPKV